MASGLPKRLPMEINQFVWVCGDLAIIYQDCLGGEGVSSPPPPPPPYDEPLLSWGGGGGGGYPPPI